MTEVAAAFGSPVGRGRVTRLAFRPTLRVMPRALLTSATIGIPALVALRTANHQNVSGTLQFVAVALAMLAAFSMGDEAFAMAESTPTPRWLRTSWRVGLVVGWTGTVWVASIVVARLLDPVGTAEAALRVRTVHLVMLTAMGIVTGLIAATRGTRTAGPVGSTVVVVSAFGALVAPTKWPITFNSDPALLRQDLLRVGLPLVVLAWVAMHDRGRPRGLTQAKIGRRVA